MICCGPAKKARLSFLQRRRDRDPEGALMASLRAVAVERLGSSSHNLGHIVYILIGL